MTGYAEWVKRHAATFCLTADAELKALLSWEPVFDAAGYSVVELNEATIELGKSHVLVSYKYTPKMERHLAAIHSVIREARAVVYRRSTEDYEETHGTCSLCNSSGFVAVPHIRSVVGSEWLPMKVARGMATYYEQVVLCSCALGRWKGGRYTADEPKPMTMEYYESKNPYWREQMNARRRVLFEEFRSDAGVEAEEIVQELAAMWKRVLQQANS